MLEQRTEYVITAYSKKLNETQRQLNLQAKPIQDPVVAELTARDFAEMLKKRGRADDWVGKATLETLTILTK